MINERIDIIASSLSSYFGVGFNTVQEQLDMDLGKTPKVFDDNAQDRMDLGNIMENACLDYFEKKMGIVIDERNSEIKFAVDNKLKCKRDGRTFLDGVETGVENKYSNAQSCFIDDKGYMLQCQAYMMAFELDQWLLLGMWQGKPVSKLIKADKEVQADIETVVNAVFDILVGLSDIESYPWEVIAKYSSLKQQKELSDEELTDKEKKILQTLGKLNIEIKALEEKRDVLKDYAKEHFADSKYGDDSFNYSIYTSDGRSNFDKHLFSIEHPTIDIEKYYKKGSPFQTIKITEKKA